MHSCFIVATSLTSLALAFPGSLSARGSTPCMFTSEAEQVAQNFANLIGQPFSSTLAQAALAKNFTDYSDSVIELINSGCSGPLTLGQPTFTNRSTFIESQSTQQPIPFQILNLWNTCTTVIMRWRTSAPGTVQPEQEVTGIIVLETIPNPNNSSNQTFLIDTVYSEFNSGAWLIDIGNFTPSCTTASRRDVHRGVNIRQTGRGTFL